MSTSATKPRLETAGLFLRRDFSPRAVRLRGNVPRAILMLPTRYIIMDTKEIMELLSDPKQSEEVITAAVVYCKEGEQQYKEELAAKDEKIEAMQAELDALKQKSKDDFITELVQAGKLAPKDEEAERMWRDCFEANPDNARKLAAKVQGDNGGETVAGGKTDGGDDDRSAEAIFQDDCPKF